MAWAGNGGLRRRLSRFSGQPKGNGMQSWRPRQERPDAERAHRAYERAQTAEAKERQRLYVESRLADVELLNEELQDDVARLHRLLADTLTVDDFLDFETLSEPDRWSASSQAAWARNNTP